MLLHLESQSGNDTEKKAPLYASPEQTHIIIFITFTDLLYHTFWAISGSFRQPSKSLRFKVKWVTLTLEHKPNNK